MTTTTPDDSDYCTPANSGRVGLWATPDYSGLLQITRTTTTREDTDSRRKIVVVVIGIVIGLTIFGVGLESWVFVDSGQLQKSRTPGNSRLLRMTLNYSGRLQITPDDFGPLRTSSTRKTPEDDSGRHRFQAELVVPILPDS